jgi:glycosyltransferase involved in cell wall biosynthesis
MTGHAVDVLLPIRLPAPWLSETLASLTAQTTSDWHLIAVIHGDPGDLEEVILSSTPDATIIHAPSSASLSEVLNLGIKVSTAPFIARMDADDIAEPQRLARQQSFLEEWLGVALVCSPVTIIDEQGQVSGAVRGAGTQLFRELRWKNVIAHPTVMVRRSAVEQAGGYDPDARHVEDYELWLRLAAAWQLAELPEPLLRYRIHSAQVTQTKGIPAASRAVVGRARRALARSRGESVFAARVRQFFWSAPQVVRFWQRGGS